MTACNTLYLPGRMSLIGFDGENHWESASLLCFTGIGKGADFPISFENCNEGQGGLRTVDRKFIPVFWHAHIAE